MQEEKEGNDQQLIDAVPIAQASRLGVRLPVSAAVAQGEACQEGQRLTAGWGGKLDSCCLCLEGQSFSQAQEGELEWVLNDDGYE